MSLLDQIDGPEDVRGLSREELHELVVEARERHVDVTSKVGGHFGASLGVAELTVALHYTFETPRDKLIWDTGHQGYIHKILTGRNERLSTIRQKDGLAPFLRRDESEYDHFGAGHAATSISAALGMAIARDLNGDDFSVVAIIGDGAMGCGLAYEALNNAGHTDRHLIVVLNDNDHSIAPNVGAMNKYLTGVRTNPVYNRIRGEVKDLLSKGSGGARGVMRRLAGRMDEKLKSLFVPGMLFEELGFRYIGPIDGHDLDSLVDTLARVRALDGPILVHVITQKGKGFSLAEEDAYTWHARPPFDKISGEVKKGSGGLPRYQKVFGKGLKELGELDSRVVAFTGGCPTEPARTFSARLSRTGFSTWALRRATRSRQPQEWRQAEAYGPSSASTLRSCKGASTASCTTSRSRIYRSCFVWTEPGWRAPMGPRTTVRSIFRTCCSSRV